MAIFDVRSILKDSQKVLREAPEGVADSVGLINTGTNGNILGALTIDGLLEHLVTDLDILARELVASGMLSAMEHHAMEIGPISLGKFRRR